MARKGKVGLDYFSHDVDILQDKKIKILKAKHGLIGYAVFLRLLEELYRDNGYYLHIDEDFDILFSDENNIDYNVYINILNDCINKELFNKEIYKKYQILTSARIQTNYCNATERRKSVDFTSEYLLIDVTKIYNSSKVDVNILSLNDDINGENEDNSTQSKEEESKKKEKKKESIYREDGHLAMTTAEKEKIESDYNRIDIDSYIDRVFNFAGNKKYKSLNLTVRNWIRKDKDNYTKLPLQIKKQEQEQEVINF